MGEEHAQATHRAGQTPSPWELVLRQQEQLQRTLEDVRKAMLTADRFDEYQRGTDRRFEALDKRQADWESKSEGAHRELAANQAAQAREVALALTTLSKEVDAKVTAVEDKADKREDDARSKRGQFWLALGLVVAGVVFPRVWEVLQGTGAAP